MNRLQACVAALAVFTCLCGFACAPKGQQPAAGSSPHGRAARGSASPSPDVADRQWLKVLEVWNTAQLPQVRTLRQAVDESPLDDAARKRIDDELRKSEATLRRLVADARRDPAKADDVLKKLLAFQLEQGATMQKLFTPEQYKAVGQRNVSMGIQLSVLASDPRQFAQTLDGFNLTPEQKAKIDPPINRLAAKVDGLKANLEAAKGPRGRIERVMDSMDEVYGLAADARSQIRAALTPEQRERFDTGYRHDRPDRGRGED